MSTFHASQNQNPKCVYMYACRYVCGRFLSPSLISLKFGRTVVSIENCGSMRPNEGELGVTQI